MPMSTAINPNKTAKTMLSITSSRCSYCSRVIEKQLTKMPGIKDVGVSYLTDTALVRYDPEKATIGTIRESIKKLGYDTVERHYK